MRDFGFNLYANYFSERVKNIEQLSGCYIYSNEKRSIALELCFPGVFFLYCFWILVEWFSSYLSLLILIGVVFMCSGALVL